MKCNWNNSAYDRCPQILQQLGWDISGKKRLRTTGIGKNQLAGRIQWATANQQLN